MGSWRVLLIHDVISIVLIFCLGIYLWLIWPRLPDIIPIHFHGADPDSYGSKWHFLIMLAIPIFVYLLGVLLRAYAYKFPYEGGRLGENMEQLLKEKLKVSWIFLCCVLLFCVMGFILFQAALPKAQQTDHLQYIFLGILTVGVCLYILFLIFRGKRQRS